MMCNFLSEFPVNDQEAQMRVLCVLVKHDALTERITEESGTQTSPTRPAVSAFTKRRGHLKKAEELWLISNISTDVSLLLVLNIHDQTSYTTKTELLLVWAAEISHRLQEIIQHLKSSALNLLILLLRLTTFYSVSTVFSKLLTYWHQQP